MDSIWLPVVGLLAAILVGAQLVEREGNNFVLEFGGTGIISYIIGYVIFPRLASAVLKDTGKLLLPGLPTSSSRVIGGVILAIPVYKFIRRLVEHLQTFK
jgi:hypothetical protein